MSLHDVRADRLVCSDGREIREREEGEYCRRVQKMEWVGLDNYRRFFAKTDRNIERAGKELAKLNPVKFTEDGVGWDPSTMSKGRYPRLTDAGEALMNNLIWLIMFRWPSPSASRWQCCSPNTSYGADEADVFLPVAVADGDRLPVPALLQHRRRRTADVAVQLVDGVRTVFWAPMAGPTSALSSPPATQIAYCVIIYLAGLTAINAELIEAGSSMAPQASPCSARSCCPAVARDLHLRGGDDHRRAAIRDLVHVMTVGDRNPRYWHG